MGEWGRGMKHEKRNTKSEKPQVQRADLSYREAECWFGHEMMFFDDVAEGARHGRRPLHLHAH